MLGLSLAFKFDNGQYADSVQAEVSPYQSEKVRQLALARAESVKDEVIQTLRSAENNVRYDELGNAYYLDVQARSADNNTPDKRVR